MSGYDLLRNNGFYVPANESDLLLALHAGANKRDGSSYVYDAAYSGWDSLTGSRDLALINKVSPYFAGDNTVANPNSCNFDGVDDYGSFNSNNINFSDGYYTIIVTFKKTVSGVTSIANCINRFYLKITDFSVTFNVPLIADYTYSAPSNVGDIVHIAFCFKLGDYVEAYKNGVSLGTKTIGTPTGVATNFWLSRNQYGGYGKENLYNFMVYKGILTPTQIQQNYNAGLVWATAINVARALTLYINPVTSASSRVISQNREVQSLISPINTTMSRVISFTRLIQNFIKPVKSLFTSIFCTKYKRLNFKIKIKQILVFGLAVEDLLNLDVSVNQLLDFEMEVL